MGDAPGFHPLAVALEAAVPLRIMEFRRRGGPSPAEIESVREFSRVLGAKGDVLMFGGRKGEAAALFNELARCIAVCAFQPGGISIFGRTWCATAARRRPPRRILRRLK